MTGPTKHGVFIVIGWRGIWHTNFEGGTRSSKKLASCVRQGLQGMGCSKLLAEGGIGHTNFELRKGLFDGVGYRYKVVIKNRINNITYFKKVSKNRRRRGRETLYFVYNNNNNNNHTCKRLTSRSLSAWTKIIQIFYTTNSHKKVRKLM